jgi:GT2 family glycosyltransferase
MVSISIHIVTYNSEKNIQQCLSSLYKQTFRNYKILLIDNNSRLTIDKIANKYNVFLVQNKQNIGYAAAHNMAIKLTQSKYILTLNPDIILDKFFLQRMFDTMEKSDKKMGSAAGLLYRVNTLEQKTNIVDAAGLDMTKSRKQKLRFENETDDKISHKTQHIFGPDGAAAFYKREMLYDINVNGEIFDEDFFMYKEDVDICWRAQLYGWRSIFVPTATAYHIRSFRPGRRTHMPQPLKRFSVRNRYSLIVKNDLIQLFVRDIFRILLYEIQILGYVLIREQSSFSAYIQAVGQIPLMIRKRKHIQAHRRVDVQYMKRWFTS